MMVHARWLMGVAWLFLLAVANAADPPAEEQPQPAVVETSPQPAAAEQNPQPAAAEEGSIREQTIYVPYSKLRQVFEQEGRGVFVPYEQFQKLWKQAQEALRAEPDQPPPVAALITEIESEATIGDQVVNVTAKLKLELLREGWHEIPLRLADASIQSARLGDQPARLLIQSSGYSLLVRKQGDEPETRELTLQYSKAFTKTPGQNRLALQAPQAPVNQWRITIPQPGVKVNVQPLVAATEPPPPAADEPPATETVLMAFVGAAESLRIDWTPKAEGATGLEALAMVQAQQQVTVDEGVVRTRTQLTYKISRAELAQLTIETPADHRVLNVFDPNVREWTVETVENRNRIRVQLYEPARDTQQVTVELEKFSDDLIREGVQVPVIRAENVGRQQGIVVVGISDALRAEVTGRSGLLQLDASELPAALTGGRHDFSYRYASVPFELTLAIEKVQPEIRTRELVEAYLEPEQLTLNLLAVYDIARAGVFQLELNVPADFDVRRVEGYAAGDILPVAVDTHHRPGDDKSRLVVNLSSKALGRVGLFVELQRRLEDPNLLSPTGQVSSIPVPVPRVAPEGIEQSTGRMIVYAPESLRVNPDRQQGVQTISTAEALEGLESARRGRFAGTREVLAYAYTAEPVDLSLNVERRKPYVTCRQLLAARVESGVIKYTATFFYEVQYSGVRSLRLDVPAERADQIRNQTPNVARETRIAPQPDDVAEGYVAWNLTGETEFLGQVTLRFAWDQKIGDLEVQRTVSETVPRLVTQGIDLASGQIVLAKAETLDVRPAGDPKGLQPIDPTQDLMPGAPVEDAARAFEFQDDARGTWELVVDITRYELVEVKRTSIERAVVRAEVTRGNEISIQALYRVRSARQRLPLELPATPKFDSDPLRINGRSVALEQGEQGEYFIPLTGQNAEEPFLLELRYSVPGTRDRLELPRFTSADTDTQPAVQKVYLCAYLPRELKLLGSRGPWTDEMDYRWYEPQPTARQSDRQLVSWVTEGLNVPDPFSNFATDGRLYLFSTIQPAPDSSLRLVAIHKNLLSGIVFAVVLLGGLLLIRQPLTQKFAAVALLITLLLLAGVFLPLLARQVLDGALLTAVLIVLVVWSVWYLVRLSRVSSAWWTRRLAALPSSPHTGTAPPAAATGAPPPADGGANNAADPAPAQSPFGTAANSQQEGGNRDA